MRPSTESPTLDERATTSETTSLTPSFALVLLPRGFVLRPRPPWPGARRSDRLERASRALDHLAHAYDRAWRELAREMLHLRVIPRDGALDGLSLAYVDGRCACEVWDYRGRTPAGVPDVETVTLRTTSGLIAADAKREAEGMEALDDEEAAMARRLALEGAMLAATKPRLRLELVETRSREKRRRDDEGATRAETRGHD